TTNNPIEIKLFNVVGTLTRKAEINSSRQQLSIDISNLAPGTYFLKVNENNRYSTKKIMIVH
ncbi:MAG TPA: T9SS type A sorting domain-containing protein, partial [Bacteroidales bacterium]|nr:T9SS type A sorting domain-containing protein [Bacteroidales bacterium]